MHENYLMCDQAHIYFWWRPLKNTKQKVGGGGGEKKNTHTHTFIQNLQQRKKLTDCDWKSALDFPPDFKHTNFGLVKKKKKNP